MFSNKVFTKGEVVCVVPGYIQTECNSTDRNSSYSWGLECKIAIDNFDVKNYNISFDASAFEGCPLSPDRVGHLLNSSNPFVSPPYNAANVSFEVTQMRCGNDTTEWVVACIAKSNILALGTELLVDYHWHLCIENEYSKKHKKFPCKCSKCTGTYCK